MLTRWVAIWYNDVARKDRKMELKTSALSILLVPLLAAGASNCIVSGSINRTPTHSAEATAENAAAYDLRAGGSGTCVHVATPTDEFEARAWSHGYSTEVGRFNCLPPSLIISFR